MTFAAVLVEIVGWAGAGCLLAAYWLLSSQRIDAGVMYQVMNLAGAAMLAVNGLAHRALPSVALNAIWILIALTALRTRRAGTVHAEARQHL